MAADHPEACVIARVDHSKPDPVCDVDVGCDQGDLSQLRAGVVPVKAERWDVEVSSGPTDGREGTPAGRDWGRSMVEPTGDV